MDRILNFETMTENCPEENTPLQEEVQEDVSHQESEVESGTVEIGGEQDTQVAEEKIDPVTERLDSIQSDLASLNERLSGYLTNEGIVNATNKAFGDALSYLKTETIRSAALELCMLRESYISLCNNLRMHSEEQTVEGVISNFENFQISIDNALQKCGVEITRSDEYDPKLQQILKIEPTEDEALNKTIAKDLTSAYLIDGKVVSPQKIILYRYKRN